MGNLATTINVVLGIFNAFMLLRARRVALLVVPTIPQEGPAIAEDPDTHEIRVQVVNLSGFPVYVNEIGLQRRGHKEGTLKFPAPTDRPYPILLNAREAIRVQPAPDDYMRVIADRFSYAYARTACGRTRRGTSPTLQTLERHIFESKNPSSWLAGRSLRLCHTWQRIADRILGVFD